MFLGSKSFIFSRVMDLQAFLVPPITLKPLISSFPCFANIYVSLMKKGLY